MKICLLSFIFVFASGFGFCQSVKSERQEDKPVIVARKENRKYGLTATFHGIDFHFGDEKNTVEKIITYVVF